MEAENFVPEEKPVAIVKSVSSLPAVKTPRAIVMLAALEEEREQRILLKKYVEEFMIENEDYGVIPGTDKGDKKARKGLFKPGAEKLLDLFRCRPEYEIIARDVDRAAGLYAYEIRCKAVSRETDTVLNEGVGSASSYESKYRYRNADRTCPACGGAFIKKSKFPPKGSPPSTPPGWYCYAKLGGCGVEFASEDPVIVGQVAGKIQNPDLADVANTVLKMAKKRAQVDCAIALARVSDMFTQDIEDMVDHVEALQAPRPAPTVPPTGAVGTALWQRLVDLHGKGARTLWDKGIEQIGLKGIVQPQKVPQGSIAALEAALFPPVSPDEMPEPDARDV